MARSGKGRSHRRRAELRHICSIQDIVRNKPGILIAAGGGTSKFTGESCSPYGFMWAYDSYALANTMGRAVMERGGKSWFFLPVDYAWGEALSADLSAAIKASGGKIVGSVKTPLNTPDYFCRSAAGPGIEGRCGRLA